jgi:hypothetical protein
MNLEKEFCMNTRVYFTVTPKGQEIIDTENDWRERNIPIDTTEKPFYKNWYTMLLWQVFELFGKFLSAGSDSCVERFVFDEPGEKNES